MLCVNITPAIETPRLKQQGVLLYYNFFFVASDGEFIRPAAETAGRNKE
jgi:hypothetical protein